MKLLLFVIAMSCVGCATDDATEEQPPDKVDPPVASDLMDPTIAGDPSEAPPTQARQYFDEYVYPVLKSRCGGCHMMTTTPTSVGFIAPNPAAAYGAIKLSGVVGDASVNAPIVKLNATLHPPQYTEKDLAIILEWLRLEREGL